MADGAQGPVNGSQRVRVLPAALLPPSMPAALTYSLDGEPPAAGTLVRVPLRQRTLTGVVLETGAAGEQAAGNFVIRPVKAVLDARFSLPASLLALLEWASRYFHSPLGQVLIAALPKAILAGKMEDKPADALYAAVPGEGENAALKAAYRQRELLAWLQEHGPASGAQIQAAGFGAHLLSALRKTGRVRAVVATPSLGLLELGESPHALNPAQQRALQRIASDPGPFLLDGVTGSGKTEVYLQAMHRYLQRGRQVLYLVPEIGLIDQTLKRARRRYGTARVLAYHSSATETEKLACWRAVRAGEAVLVIGTRSAIFLPFVALGLILVDEEQDLSYKQQQGFRYNARDLAAVRSMREGAQLILGSASASTETLRNARTGRYCHLVLDRRIGDRPLPVWQFVPPAWGGLPLAEASIAAIERELAAGHQVLVFLNRRGFAPLLECANCRWQARCAACGCALTLHRSPVALLCHRCEQHLPPPSLCPECQSRKLQAHGPGTEQLEAFLTRRFAGVDCVRIDRDSTQRKGSFAGKLATLEAGKPAILVGTQMIAKGHHLPGISLVVALSSDIAMFSHDYRAMEQMAQSLTQVAGRAGRGAAAGSVVVETRAPEHPLLQLLAANNYQRVGRYLLDQRKARHLPPFSAAAVLHASDRDLAALRAFMDDCAARLRGGRVDLVGPLPSPIERLKHRFRYQIQIFADRRAALHRALDGLEAHLGGRRAAGHIRWGIDVDPLSLD